MEATKTKILVISVDDEPDVRVLYKYYFNSLDEGYQFELRFTQDHQQCIDWLQQSGPNTVVLMDISLPKMSGLERLGQISQQFPQAKVVMVSGYGQAEYGEKCRQLGAADYLQKPVDFELLKKCILSLCQFKTEV